MPMSPYVSGLRTHVGNRLLLLPGVTAVLRRAEEFLLARQRDTQLWSLVGGSVEPGEEPADAVRREVAEELGITPTVGRIIGAYGGPDLVNTYPNGDEVAYVTVAYECGLPKGGFELEQAELLEVAWFTRAEVANLPRHSWVDRVLADCEILDRAGSVGN